MITTSKNWQVLNDVNNMTSLYLYGQLNKPDLLSKNILKTEVLYIEYPLLG